MIMRIRFAIAVAATLSASPVFAGDDWVPPVMNPLVQKECGSCHMAFQPAFLPARSWNRMMDELATHFGDDASLPPQEAKTIRAYLTANAGDVILQGRAHKYMKWIATNETPQKITENPDFARKHNFKEQVWKDPKVVTKSNCLACHPGANKGLYDDD